MNWLLSAGLEYIKGRLITVLKNSGSNAIIKDILCRYSELPLTYQIRALISAEMGDILKCYAMQSSVTLDEAGLQDLHETLGRELAISRLFHGHDASSLFDKINDSQGFWGPLGDVFVSKKTDKELALTRAPIVGNSIVVDFDSKLARSYQARSGVLSQPMLELTSSERQSVVEKLESALNVIDAIEPIYGAMIRNFNRRIIIRKSVDKRENLKTGYPLFSSEHTFQYPCSIRLLNVHLPEQSLDRTVESLLHESSHCMMALYEGVSGRKLSDNYEDFRPVSPWSGNAIPNASFAHAVFIYHVCFRFFEKWRNRKYLHGIDPNHLKTRSAHFASGFLLVDRLSDSLIVKGGARSDLVKMIDHVQSSIKGSIHPTHMETA